MTKQLAKACSQIAESLPRADLSLVLYPTISMQEAVARLYAIIMKFIVRGLRWYRQSKVMHALSSITRPWALEFDQDVREVQQYARSVEELAQSASRAELREARFQIHQTRSDLEAARNEIRKLSSLVEDGFRKMTDFALASRSLQTRTFNDIAISKGMLCSIQISQILSLPFMEALPTSGQCFAHSKSFYVRRQASRRYRGVSLPDNKVLQAWKAQQSLSFVVTQTRSQISAKDLTVDMISALRNYQLPVLWALPPPDLQNSSLNTLDVIRMLFYQALQLNTSALNTDYPVTIAQLRDASSHGDWLALLGRVLQGLPTIYIIFDSELVDYVTNGDKSLATKFLIEFAKALGPVTAKLIVSSHTFEAQYAEKCLGVNAVVAVRTEESSRSLVNIRHRRARKVRSKDRR
ncbi:hypothetical protein TWF694_006331 [Orbilia ellipsospora]